MDCVGISLGMKCDATLWAVENKFRKKKEEGYCTCPFDEMITNYPGIVECIRDDFKYFYDPEYLKIIQLGDQFFIHHTKYRFIFNHESPGHADLYITQQWPEGPNHFVNNNYAHFIERYSKRVTSFRNYLLNKNNYIYFILQRYNTYQIDLDNLKDALKINYPHLKYEVILLFLDNKTARNNLQLMKFTENEEEMDRLNYWYG